MNKPFILDIGDTLRDGDKEYKIASFVPSQRKVNVSDSRGRTSSITLDQANDWKAAYLGIPTRSDLMRELCNMPGFDQMLLSDAEYIISDIQGWWDKSDEDTRSALWGDNVGELVEWYGRLISGNPDKYAIRHEDWKKAAIALSAGKKLQLV